MQATESVVPLSASARLLVTRSGFQVRVTQAVALALGAVAKLDRVHLTEHGPARKELQGCWIWRCLGLNEHRGCLVAPNARALKKAALNN